MTNASERVRTTATVGKGQISRAPLASTTRERLTVIVLNENDDSRKRKKWDPDRFKNNTKYSFQKILTISVNCHGRLRLHNQDDHICKKGKSFEECGVTIKDGMLWCCDKPKRSKISALTDHVARKSHDT